MPVHAPAVSLKLRKFRRRFGITAPRVVVRSHWPWPWLAGAASLFLVFLVGLVWLFLQRNEVGVLGVEIVELRRQLEAQQVELDVLRSTQGTGKNAMLMEQAAQRQLLAKLDALERENASLKEDIRVFERLVPAVADESRLRIESFRVLSDGESRYRYRLLMAFQAEKQAPEFRGRLQMLVSYVLDGREGQQLLPQDKSASPEYGVEIRNFLRREGAFRLPPGAVVKSVEARILQGDVIKARRSAQL